DRLPLDPGGEAGPATTPEAGGCDQVDDVRRRQVAGRLDPPPATGGQVGVKVGDGFGVEHAMHGPSLPAGSPPYPHGWRRPPPPAITTERGGSDARRRRVARAA